MSLSATSSLSRKAKSPSAAAVGPADLVRAYAICVEKTRRNIARLADRPKSAALAIDGDYFAFGEGFNDIGNWTSSFFTGMALLAFETTEDAFFLKQTSRLADAYQEKVVEHAMDTMHDLGFLYSLYSVATYKLTGDKSHRLTALKAADELAKRFSPKGGYIQAWGRMDEKKADFAGLAIIDCMMNLQLLFWAAQETGNRFYSEIAAQHADTTLHYFIRTDDSIYHAYRFDLATGAPLRGDFHCGFGVESHWARGTAWAIYGFALAYGYTSDAKYLDAADRLARKFLSLLDAELVPVWDFRLPKTAKRLRDSSAAAVAVCGLQELLKYRPRDGALAKATDGLLGKLCSTRYLDADVRCPGVLKDAQIGGGESKAQNAYTSWGDYFFMEALARKLHGTRGYW